METLASILLIGLAVLAVGWFLFPVIVNIGLGAMLLVNKTSQRPNTPEQYELGRAFAKTVWHAYSDSDLSVIVLKSHAEREQAHSSKGCNCAYAKGILDELETLRKGGK